MHDTAGSQRTHRETRHARRETRALSTTDCRGARRRGLVFRLTARTGSREANVRPDSPQTPSCEVFGVGATMRDTQADVPSAKWLWAQLAFKNSMIRGILQFTPSIAFRYVLHRCESRDIRCRESFCITVKTSQPTHTVSGAIGGTLLLKFLGAVRAGVRCSVGGTRACGSLSAPEGRRDNSTCSPTVLGTGGF